jgi:hypothetical protein
MERYPEETGEPELQLRERHAAGPSEEREREYAASTAAGWAWTDGEFRAEGLDLEYVLISI